ncbi:MAG: acyl carrier protein [Candidatus Omnitrophota bacterium]
MAKQDFEQIKKEVKKIVSNITEIPIADLKENARFVEDLGVDSMMALEIVASIEKKYRVVVPEQEIAGVTSLEKVYEILEKLFDK